MRVKPHKRQTRFNPHTATPLATTHQISYLFPMPKTLEIIKIPDPILRQKSAAIERVDDTVRAYLDDMLQTMYQAPGVGLAAIQLANPIRAIVMDITTRQEDEPKNPICMINPKILELGNELRLHEEGCLSIPEVYAEIERPGTARVAYIDRNGKPAEMLCEGFLATVVQHEIDHLDGKLFIDFLSRLKRDMIVRKFVKAQKASETAI